MYYHGVVTYGNNVVRPGNMQVPNALAHSQFLERLDKMLKNYTSKFLATLDPAHLHQALNALLDGMGAMDGNFNESTLKAFLQGMLKPYASDVVVQNEPNVGQQRMDLLVTTTDGRQAIFEFKTLMPHQLALPSFSTNTNTNTNTNTTHFWSASDKEAVHKALQEMPRAQLLATPLKKTYANAKTAGAHFANGMLQLREYGAKFAQQQARDHAKLGIAKPLVPPKLFLVSTVWNLHLAIEEITLPVRQPKNVRK
jgi:hypothetical protein